MLILASCHSEPTCDPGACNAIPIVGEVVPGVFGATACGVDDPLTPMTLPEVTSDWCAGNTSTAYSTHTVDLLSCDGNGSARYWRANIEDACCTDASRGYDYIWTDKGKLVYAREWVPGVGYWCCCGQETPEIIYGEDPGVSCVAADPASVCN